MTRTSQHRPIDKKLKRLRSRSSFIENSDLKTLLNTQPISFDESVGKQNLRGFGKLVTFSVRQERSQKSTQENTNIQSVKRRRSECDYEW